MSKASKHAKEIIEFLGCPREVVSAGKTAEEMTGMYMKKLKRGRAEGFTPVIIEPDRVLCDMLDGEKPKDFRKKVLGSEEFDVEKWFDDIYERDKKYFKAAPAKLDDDELEKTGSDRLTGMINFMTGLSNEIIIAEIPEKDPWKIFAYIPFGGWNECPANDELMFVTKYWHEKHGAVPAVITHDVLEMYLEKPVSPEEAKKLAREQYLFCSDIISQGYGRLNVLEEALKTSTVWYFWWD